MQANKAQPDFIPAENETPDFIPAEDGTPSLVNAEDLPGSTPKLRLAAAKLPSAMSTPTQFENERNPKNFKESGVGSFGKDIIGMIAGSGGLVDPTTIASSGAQLGARIASGDIGRSSEHGLPYRIAAATATPLANVEGIESAADVGNTGAVVGHMAAGMAPAALPLVKGMSRLTPGETTPFAKLYSPEADAISATLRSNARVNVPETAHAALPALKESIADRGYTPADFQGRQGPHVLQDAIDHAVELQESRAKQVIDPIRGDVVSQTTLNQHPELASQFPKGKPVTYDMLDAKRVELNKALRRANYYSKDPTAQAAVGPDLDNMETAARQAREVIYDQGGKRTGIDVRPFKQTEASLLKLSDLAEVTKNALQSRAAQFENTPFMSKASQTAKHIFAATRNPTSAASFMSDEKPGLFGNPTRPFARSMKTAFGDVVPKKADTSLRLNIAPPEGPHPAIPFRSVGSLPESPARTIAPIGKESAPALPSKASGSSFVKPTGSKSVPSIEETSAIPTKASGSKPPIARITIPEKENQVGPLPTRASGSLSVKPIGEPSALSRVSPSEANNYLLKAGGDKNLAARLAAKDGKTL